ncbi:MAG: FHA domain-containing protein [Chloroflexota bacterium]
MAKQQISSLDLHLEYIRLRQCGWSPNDVLRQLQPQTSLLNHLERQHLVRLAQVWESRDGWQYKTIQRTIPTAESVLSRTQPVVPSPAANPVRRITPLPLRANPPDELPPMQTCPDCGKINSRKDVYCYSCGHVLETFKLGTKQLHNCESPVQQGSSHFDQHSVLVLTINGASHSFEISPRWETFIGRSDKSTPMHPDIDLAAYNAEALGVSRFHASFKRLENGVTICDLSSTNHTYVNNQCLHPHEIRLLCNGDDLQLGKLSIKVTFRQQQVRRVK